MDEEIKDQKRKIELSPRISFVLGVLGAVALFGVVGFGILLRVYLKDKGAASGAQRTLSEESPPSAPKGEVPSVVDEDNIRGNKDGKVTIIEYSDLECPFCKIFHPEMLKVMATYPKDVRWVYRHFPIDSIHPNARKESEASECAAEQGKFWEYVDKVFERTKSNGYGFALEDLPKLAKELGLDTKKFNDCYNGSKYAQKVEDQLQGAIKAGVTGTPGNFINGIEVKGAVPFEQLKQIIDQELQKG